MAAKVAGSFKLLISEAKSGAENMDIDLALFNDLEKGVIAPTIRFYSWKPACVSFGYSQKPEDLIDPLSLKKLGWDIIKRPTGGGAAFHNTDEVAYSIVGRCDDEMFSAGISASYKIISKAVIWGLAKLGINAELSKTKKSIHSGVCFSYPASHEIVVRGRKIVGSAQKRGKKAFLQHGSIFVSGVENIILSAIKGTDVKVLKDSYVTIQDVLGRKPSFDEIVCAMKKSFAEALDVKL